MLISLVMLVFYPFDDAKVRLFAHTAKHFVHFSFILASFLIYLKEASRIVKCPSPRLSRRERGHLI